MGIRVFLHAWLLYQMKRVMRSEKLNLGSFLAIGSPIFLKTYMSVCRSFRLSVSLTTTHCSFCLIAADLSVYTRSQCRKNRGTLLPLSQNTASCTLCVPLKKGVQSPLLLVHPRREFYLMLLTVFESVFVRLRHTDILQHSMWIQLYQNSDSIWWHISQTIQYPVMLWSVMAFVSICIDQIWSDSIVINIKQIGIDHH